jgi:hypothetical protein
VPHPGGRGAEAPRPARGGAAAAGMAGPGGRGAGFPRGRRCGRGDLVPLSDFGPQGGEVRYKAWVCTNPGCGFALLSRRGEVVRHRGAPPRSPGRPRRR